jgi:CRP-like cAMP-binding protein
MMDIFSAIEQARFFEGISRRSREALAKVCLPLELRKQAVLFREADPGEAIYMLVGGRVALHKLTPDGREVVIKVIQPGEVFAEVILFEQKAYPVTAVALTDINALRIFRRDILGLLGQEDFRNDFIAMLLRKQRYLADKVQQITSQDVEDRLRSFLREQYGELQQICVEMNKKQLAAAIGVTPETLSRLLNQLKTRKSLLWQNHVLTIAPAFWSEQESGR